MIRFIGDEGPEIQVMVNENVTCLQILNETGNNYINNLLNLFSYIYIFLYFQIT